MRIPECVLRRNAMWPEFPILASRMGCSESLSEDIYTISHLDRSYNLILLSIITITRKLLSQTSQKSYVPLLRCSAFHVGQDATSGMLT
jgi:hypothetical protein